jgi:hypothetical protein
MRVLADLNLMRQSPETQQNVAAHKGKKKSRSTCALSGTDPAGAAYGLRIHGSTTAHANLVYLPVNRYF